MFDSEIDLLRMGSFSVYLVFAISKNRLSWSQAFFKNKKQTNDRIRCMRAG